MTSLEKLKAMAKFNRLQTLKKFMAYSSIVVFFSFVLSFKGLCFVFVGNFSWLSNSRFFMLILNITIVTLTTKSRLLTAQPSTRNDLYDLYDELVKKNRPRLKEVEKKPCTQRAELIDRSVDKFSRRDEKTEEEYCRIENAELVSTGLRENSGVVELVCPVELESDCNTVAEIPAVEETGETDEELQRRADDFIAKFRSQIRKGV